MSGQWTVSAYHTRRVHNYLRRYTCPHVEEARVKAWTDFENHKVDKPDCPCSDCQTAYDDAQYKAMEQSR